MSLKKDASIGWIKLAAGNGLILEQENQKTAIQFVQYTEVCHLSLICFSAPKPKCSDSVTALIENIWFYLLSFTWGFILLLLLCHFQYHIVQHYTAFRYQSITRS